MSTKPTDEMLAEIQAILDEDDDESLPDEDAPVRGVSTQHRRPDEEPPENPLSGAMSYIAAMQQIIEFAEMFASTRILNGIYEDAVGNWRERMEQESRVESSIIHIPQEGELLEMMQEYPSEPVNPAWENFEEPPNPSNIGYYMDAFTTSADVFNEPPILMRPVADEERELLRRIHESFEEDD